MSSRFGPISSAPAGRGAFSVGDPRRGVHAPGRPAAPLPPARGLSWPQAARPAAALDRTKGPSGCDYANWACFLPIFDDQRDQNKKARPKVDLTGQVPEITTRASGAMTTGATRVVPRCRLGQAPPDKRDPVTPGKNRRAADRCYRCYSFLNQIRS